MIKKTKTVYDIEQTIVINDKHSTIKLTVTQHDKQSRKTIRLTYFEGNNDESTYNWFQHIEDYIKHLDKHHEWDMTSHYLQYNHSIDITA